MGRLLENLDQSQQKLVEALWQLLEHDYGKVVGLRGGERTSGQAVAGLHWHETYHTEQFELLHQLAGKNDTII